MINYDLLYVYYSINLFSFKNYKNSFFSEYKHNNIGFILLHKFYFIKLETKISYPYTWKNIKINQKECKTIPMKINKIVVFRPHLTDRYQVHC